MKKKEEEEQSDEEDVFVEVNDEIVEDILKRKAIEEFKKIKKVGELQANKIWDGKYYSLMDIAAAGVGDFVDRTNILKATAESIIANARTLVDVGKIETAYDVMKNDSPIHLTTGSTAMDELLGGGYTPKLITEIHAENGVGKTQACFTAAVMAIQPKEKGGLDCNVIYVDTEGTFKHHRVAEIAEERGLDVNDVLQKIHIVRAKSSSHQRVLMDEIRRVAQEKGVRLLIIDSIIGYFRSEFCGRGALAERQQLLNMYLSELHIFADTYDACVLVTNQVSAKPDMMFGYPFVPVGGNILGHACAYRLLLRKGKAGKRVVKLVKAPDRPESEAVVTIDAKGLN